MISLRKAPINFPLRLFNYQELTLTEKLVFAFDFTLFINKKYSSYTNKNIASQLKLGENVVGRARKKYCEMDLVYKEGLLYKFTCLNFDIEDIELKKQRNIERVDWLNRYTIIPYEVFSSDILSPGAKILFSLINSLSKNRTKGCIAGNKYFMKIMGVSNNSISNWVTDLKNNGFLEFYEVISWYGGNRRTIKTKDFSVKKNN